MKGKERDYIEQYAFHKMTSAVKQKKHFLDYDTIEKILLIFGLLVLSTIVFFYSFVIESPWAIGLSFLELVVVSAYLPVCYMLLVYGLYNAFRSANIMPLHKWSLMFVVDNLVGENAKYSDIDEAFSKYIIPQVDKAVFLLISSSLDAKLTKPGFIKEVRADIIDDIKDQIESDFWNINLYFDCKYRDIKGQWGIETKHISKRQP